MYNIVHNETEFYLITIKPTGVGKGLLHFPNQPLTDLVHFSGPDRFFIPGLFSSNRALIHP